MAKALGLTIPATARTSPLYDVPRLLDEPPQLCAMPARALDVAELPSPLRACAQFGLELSIGLPLDDLVRLQQQRLQAESLRGLEVDDQFVGSRVGAERLPSGRDAVPSIAGRT